MPTGRDETPVAADRTADAGTPEPNSADRGGVAGSTVPTPGRVSPVVPNPLADTLGGSATTDDPPGERMESAMGSGRTSRGRSRRDSGEPGESHQERINRELLELLNELRVALPGVQFLLGFLLIVPFQGRATAMSEFQRDVYFVTLVAAVIASGLLIAPAAQHRVLFRKRNKEKLLKRSSRSAYAGLVLLALATVSGVLLVVDILFTRTQAWVTTALIAALLSWLWIVVPFWQRSRGDIDEPEPEPEPEDDDDDDDDDDGRNRPAVPAPGRTI